LPGLVSGSVIVSAVLNPPTTGPLLLSASLSQDLCLAGAIVLPLSVATAAGAGGGVVLAVLALNFWVMDSVIDLARLDPSRRHASVRDDRDGLVLQSRAAAR